MLACTNGPSDTSLRVSQASLVRLDEVLLDMPAPTPTIALMGDFNFPASAVTWSREDKWMLPRVAAHRQVESDSLQHRHHCNKLCELMAKHSMLQTMGGVTHGNEVLDLIWTNNQDMVSEIRMTLYIKFTDHSIIAAATSYKVKEEKGKERMFLLESGQRLKASGRPGLAPTTGLEPYDRAGQGEPYCHLQLAKGHPAPPCWRSWCRPGESARSGARGEGRGVDMVYTYYVKARLVSCCIGSGTLTSWKRWVALQLDLDTVHPPP